jgi:hypothetical protein
MLNRGFLCDGDGSFDHDGAGTDRPAAYGLALETG